MTLDEKVKKVAQEIRNIAEHDDEPTAGVVTALTSCAEMVRDALAGLESRRKRLGVPHPRGEAPKGGRSADLNARVSDIELSKAPGPRKK